MARSSDPDIRRRQLLRSIAIAGAAGLAGCSVRTGDSSSDSSSDSNGGGTGSGTNKASSATGWGWNIAASSLQTAAKTYNEQNDATISIKRMGGESWEQKFQTAITSGTGAPDFSVIQNYDVTNYASIDGLRDLTDRIDKSGMRKDIVDGKWTTVNYDGNDYAIPWDIGPTGVFYKRSAYEDAGINPENLKTWDEFIQAGKQLPDDVAMINLPSQEMPQMWRMLFRQLGGQPFTESGAVNIHSEKSVRVAQLIKDMNDTGITTRIGLWSGGWFTAFAENSLISLPSAAWMDGTLRAELPDTAGDWGVYKLPAFEKGGNRASNRGGSNMAIPTQIDDAAVVNRAWDYCEWTMTTPEVQNTILKEYGLFPSLKTAYDADIYDKKLEFYDGQAIFRLFADVAEEIERYRYTTDTPVVQQAIGTELGKVIEDGKAPKKAMQDAADTVVSRTDRELA
jgi:ABC-type glycerol-3-phosphate transport system substrate-binding protein